MPLVPLATEYAARSDGPVQRLFNMYVEKTPQGPRPFMVRGRPGLVSVASLGPGPVHWIEYANGSRYIQSGPRIYRDDTQISTVPEGGTQQVAKSEAQLVFTSGGEAYVIQYDTAPDTVTQISDPDLPAVSGVIFGPQARFYFPNEGLGQFHYSAIGDATVIDGLAFANAEADPDPIIRGAMLGGNLMWCGPESIENHQGTTDIAEPTIRVRELTQTKGTQSPFSVVTLDNGLFFVGDDEGGRGVFRTDGGIPPRISSPTIDAHLEASDDLGAVTAFALVKEGHSWYVVNIPGQGSFAYDIATQSWAEWGSYEEPLFRIRTGTNGVYGDTYGNLYTFSATTHADGADPLIRVCAAFLPVERRQRCNVVTLECATGVGTSEGQGASPVAEQRYTDEVTGDWTDWDATDLGALGDRALRAAWWQLGLMAPPGRYMEFRCSDPVPFICAGLSVNARP